MGFFTRVSSRDCGVSSDDITDLTRRCQEIISGSAPKKFSGNPGLKSLAEAIDTIYEMSSSPDNSAEISTLLEVFTRVAEGDLEARIVNQDRNSEIGRLATSINDFLNMVQCFMAESGETMRAIRDGEYYRRILPEGMRGEFLRRSKTINSIGDQIQRKDQIVKSMTEKFITNVRHMIDSTADLAPKASVMSDTASHTKEFCNHAVRSASETRSSVQTVASAAEELSSSIAEISSQLGRSGSLITETVEDVSNTNKAITELSTEVEQISSILNIITEISGQTNLLALNATIEAARAGEAGKGFAVVANEVKSLAQKTAEATNQITSQLQKIQDVTKIAIKTVSHIGEQIDHVQNISLDINNAMSEQSAATDEISRSAQLAAASTEEASQRIEEVDSGADDTGNAAVEMLRTVNVMAEKSTILQSDLNEFITKIG